MGFCVINFAFTLNTFGSLGGSTVVPGTEYAYSPAYPQYGNAYSPYGYSSSAGGLLSK